MNNKNSNGIFTQQWAGFLVALLLGAFAIFLGMSAIDARLSELEKADKALVLKEFNQIQAQKQLEARASELDAKEIELQNKEADLNDLEKDIQQQQVVLESSQPDLAAALLQQSYLAEFAGVDLMSPPPCEVERRERYFAALAHIDALYAAALDIGGSNRFTLFVEQQRGNNLTIDRDNCRQQ